MGVLGVWGFGGVGVGFRVWGLGFGIFEFGRLGFRVLGVWVLGEFKVWGLGFRIRGKSWGYRPSQLRSL